MISCTITLSGNNVDDLVLALEYLELELDTYREPGRRDVKIYEVAATMDLQEDAVPEPSAAPLLCITPLPDTAPPQVVETRTA
jgi:hypothetical protein